MSPLLDGLLWFVWIGVSVGIVIGWARALDAAMGGAVSAVVQGVASFLLWCAVLAVIVWLDIQAKMGG